MTVALVIKFCSLMLWCYAAVLTAAWFRAVGGEDRKTHVGHFVSLMGVFVPFSCMLVLVVLLGALVGLPSLVAFLVVLVPAGLVVGLQLELSRLVAATERVEMLRLGLTLCLTLGVIAWRGGV